ncbi:hypothetical protein [Patulibacter minatonensis]|uniref:hypothetical protein n=1 Tax=Patulibacter minatonensis TaxID=298163 RepID=UPI0004B63759|nr:hypothetical protein [Patulibacter minatonensis]
MGAVALILLIVSGWMKGGSASGWFPLFVLGLVLGAVFAARSADRKRRGAA